MAMAGDFAETVKESLDILQENIKVLADLGHELESEDLVPDVGLHQLYDMVEDVAESSKIKRAESNLAQRQAGDSGL